MEASLTEMTAGVSWTELIDNIRAIFDSDKVNVDEVKHLLSRYISNPSDWESYANFDPHR